MAVEPILWPHLGKEANLQPYLTVEYSIRSHLIRKPDERIQEPILQLHLGREPSQQSYPTIPSQQHTHTQTQSLGSVLTQIKSPHDQSYYNLTHPEPQTEMTVKDCLY